MTRHKLRRAFNYMYLGGPRDAIRPHPCVRLAPQALDPRKRRASSRPEARRGSDAREWPGSQDGCSNGARSKNGPLRVDAGLEQSDPCALHRGELAVGGH